MAKVDIDKQLAKMNLVTRQTSDEKVQTRPVTMFGRDWEVITNISTYAEMALSPDSFTEARFLTVVRELVIEEQQRDWELAWARCGLDAKGFIEAFNLVIEAATKKEQKSSSASATGRSTRVSKPS